jgi:YD repeat-containing protein
LRKPHNLDDDYVLTYDAWNRLVKVKDGAVTTGQYEYDGLGRRARKGDQAGK